MNLKHRIGQWLGRAFRALGVNTPGFLDYFLFGGGATTASGVRVSEANALTITTVYQCVRYISDMIAQMPLALYKEVDNGKEKATDHPLYRILHSAPNPLVPAFIFKKTLQAHLLLWGNAYAEIERNGAGQVTALWPLLPSSMRLELFNGRVFYYYTLPNGGEVQLTDVLHLRSLSTDGLLGLSPIALQREKLGQAKASEDYRSRFFANDARPGGVLQTDKQLGDVAFARLEKHWKQQHEGLSNTNRVAILEEGLKWIDVGIPPKDAEFIAGQEYTKADIAAIYGVPPYKIGLLKPGTVSFASVEQQAIDSVVDCIAPWVVCWENCLDLALLTPREQMLYFTKFSMQGLLRGDSQSRASFYATLFDRGVFSINDILSLEERNTIGKDGDRRFVPLNTVPLDMVDEVIRGKLEPAESDSDEPKEPQKMPMQLNGSAKLLNGGA